MELMSLLTAAGAAVVAFLGGKAIIKVDNRVEARRDSAVTLSGWAGANGLPIVSQMLRSYAIHDMSGVLHGLKQASDLIGDADASKAAIDTFLNVQLAKKVSTIDGREELIVAVEKLLNISINRESITQQPTAVAAEISPKIEA